MCCTERGSGKLWLLYVCFVTERTPQSESWGLGLHVGFANARHLESSHSASLSFRKLMSEARILSSNSLSGLESMFHPVLLVWRVGVYVTQRSEKDHERAEATHTPLTFNPPVCKELSRLSDTVRVSTNESYLLGSLFTQQTPGEPGPTVQGTTLASENVPSEAGAPWGRCWYISRKGTEHSGGEGEFPHRRRGPQSKNVHSSLPEAWGCVFSAGTLCEQERWRIGRHGRDMSRSSHLTLKSRQLCSLFFSHKTQHNNVHTLQEQLRKREAPSIWW